MSEITALVVDNLDIWTGAIERKSGTGRGGGGKRMSLYGIERLRALILDLAVRGKLVPQDAVDEPASELLRRVKAERAKLIKNKKIGREKSLPTVSNAPPFDIPEGWEWTQLSEVGHDWGQREPDSDFTYIDVSAIDQSVGVIRSPNIVAAKDAPSRARKIVRSGTIIYSTVRPYLLNIAIIDQDFAPEPIASTAFAIIHPFTGIEAGFVYRFLRSPAFVDYVESCQTGIAYPAINDRQFFSAWCPLPPSSEQRRIVAKVDELMALCDALDRESADALAAHQVLVETLLATLLNSADAVDIAANWARLESHFDTLFTTEASIEALKQTILDLAVCGKLVPQDPADESAGELLKRIPADWAASRRRNRSNAKQGNEIDSAIVPVGWIAISGNTIFRTRSGNSKLIKGKLHAEDGPERFKGYSASGQDVWLDSWEHEGVAIILSAVGARCGKAFLARGKWSAVANTHIIWLKEDVTDAEFAMLVLNNEDFWERAGGAQPFVKVGNTLDRDFLLPPLAEQRRIVAKVDELMGVCDALRARLTEAAETRRHLADAVVERAAA